jgi:hypothetical protein
MVSIETSSKLARFLINGPETVTGPGRTTRGPRDHGSVDFPTFYSVRTKQEHFRGDPCHEAVPSRRPKEMPMTEPERAECDIDPIEADVTAVLEACGGDARTAIRALLVEQLIQEKRIERLAAALSFGYVRGRIGVTVKQITPKP